MTSGYLPGTVGAGDLAGLLETADGNGTAHPG